MVFEKEPEINVNQISEEVIEVLVGLARGVIGFMKVFEGVQRIKWTGRDIEAKRCKFDFIKNNEDINFNKIN